MGVCPNCGAEVTHLILRAKAFSLYYGKGDYKDGDDEDLGYFCPECETKVCQTESEADEFLKR